MKKILVPTNFSKISENGLKLAVDIAHHIKGEIILLNIIYPADGSGFAATGDITTSMEGESAHFMAALVRKNKARLEQMIEEYKRKNVKIIPQIDFENKVHGLNNYVEENDVDLIVIGTSGNKSLTEYFFGTHTENIIKVSNCPVISIKGEVDSFDPKSIVMAIDTENYHDEELGTLQRFAELFKSEVHFLHVINDGEETEETIKKLKQIAEQNSFSAYSINTLENKNPTDAIMRYSKKRSADMLTLIAQGKKGIKELIFGSVTNDIINTIKIPVLIIPMYD